MTKLTCVLFRSGAEQPRDEPGAGEDVLPRENPSHRQVSPHIKTHMLTVQIFHCIDFFFLIEIGGRIDLLQ
jgi:hypothetical protein